MVIRDLMELFIDDQELKIYDNDKGEYIFDGMYSDLDNGEHYNLLNTEIEALDNIGKYGAKTVVININSEE